MEKLSVYDPLALTAVEFNIKSIKKYTSIATIVTSLAIVVLSITINIESIRHIWAPLNELPTTYTLDKFSQHEQSEDNPICFASATPMNSAPLLTITRKEGDVLIEESRTHLDGVGKFSYMEKHLKGKNSYLNV